MEFRFWAGWIFMFFGMLQFYFTQNIFGQVNFSTDKKLVKTDVVDNTPSNVIRDRMIVVFIFSVFTVFFWAALSKLSGFHDYFC